MAGAFARSGYPIITEDVLSLDSAGERYVVKPKQRQLRLFADSAKFLLGEAPQRSGIGDKKTFDASETLPFCKGDVLLSQIFILGSGDTSDVVIEPLRQLEALTQIIQHAFILDVEDRVRLSAHFARLAGLIETVPCYSLDFPRMYEKLPGVIRSVIHHLERSGS